MLMRILGSTMHIDDIDDEVGDADPEDDEQENALEQEVVLVGDGLVDEVAEARVLEDDLGDDAAPDHDAEGEG